MPPIMSRPKNTFVFGHNVATTESLRRIRRNRIEALPRCAARANLRIGRRSTAYDPRTAAIALSGLQGEEKRWMLETLLDWKRATTPKTPVELLRGALRRVERRLVTSEEFAVEKLMWQRDILNTNGCQRITTSGAKDSSGSLSTQESRRYFGADEAAKRELLMHENASVREYSQGWMPTGARLPFSVEELREAIKAKRHRTDEQELILDVFRVYLADRKPPSKPLADALGCGLMTIERYRHEGAKMLAEIITAEVKAIRDEIREDNDRQLKAILTALGIDPVKEAERVLEDAA